MENPVGPIPTNMSPLSVDENTGLPPGFGNKGKRTVVPTRTLPPVATTPEPVPVSSPVVNQGANNYVPEAAWEFLNNPDPNADWDPSIMYPSDLTQQMIDAWKQAFGDRKIIMITVNDRVFVFRHLLRPEYRSLKKLENTDEEYLEERIASTCTLYPRLTDLEWRAESAGLANAVATAIMRASGFNANIQPFKL